MLTGEDHLCRGKQRFSYELFFTRITCRDHQRKRTNVLAGNLKCLLRYQFCVIPYTCTQWRVNSLVELLSFKTGSYQAKATYVRMWFSILDFELAFEKRWCVLESVKTPFATENQGLRGKLSLWKYLKPQPTFRSFYYMKNWCTITKRTLIGS